MRLHPRYFNLFMLILAILALTAIVVGTFTYRSNQEERFEHRIVDSDTLAAVKFPALFSKDSISINDYDSYVILDFWASWSDLSAVSHKQLGEFVGAKNNLNVIAAAVKDGAEQVRNYQDLNNYPFQYVDGTGFYNNMNIPGLPSQIVFNPAGQVIGIFIGYQDSTRYDSLKTLLKYE